jgi:hypothetical protein
MLNNSQPNKKPSVEQNESNNNLSQNPTNSNTTNVIHTPKQLINICEKMLEKYANSSKKEQDALTSSNLKITSLVQKCRLLSHITKKLSEAINASLHSDAEEIGEYLIKYIDELYNTAEEGLKVDPQNPYFLKLVVTHLFTKDSKESLEEAARRASLTEDQKYSFKTQLKIAQNGYSLIAPQRPSRLIKKNKEEIERTLLYYLTILKIKITALLKLNRYNEAFDALQDAYTSTEIDVSGQKLQNIGDANLGQAIITLRYDYNILIEKDKPIYISDNATALMASVKFSWLQTMWLLLCYLQNLEQNKITLEKNKILEQNLERNESSIPIKININKELTNIANKMVELCADSFCAQSCATITAILNKDYSGALRHCAKACKLYPSSLQIDNSLFGGVTIHTCSLDICLLILKKYQTDTENAPVNRCQRHNLLTSFCKTAAQKDIKDLFFYTAQLFNTDMAYVIYSQVELLQNKITLQTALNNTLTKLNITQQDKYSQPHQDIVYWHLASLCKQLNKITDAEKYYLEAIKFCPSNIAALIGLGELYLDNNQYDKAKKQFDAAIQEAKKTYITLPYKSTTIDLKIASIYSKKNFHQQSIAILQAAKKLQIDNITEEQAWCDFRLGIEYFKCNNYEEAKKALIVSLLFLLGVKTKSPYQHELVTFKSIVLAALFCSYIKEYRQNHNGNQIFNIPAYFYYTFSRKNQLEMFNATKTRLELSRKIAPNEIKNTSNTDDNSNLNNIFYEIANISISTIQHVLDKNEEGIEKLNIAKELVLIAEDAIRYCSELREKHEKFKPENLSLINKQNDNQINKNKSELSLDTAKEKYKTYNEELEKSLNFFATIAKIKGDILLDDQPITEYRSSSEKELRLLSELVAFAKLAQKGYDAVKNLFKSTLKEDPQNSIALYYRARIFCMTNQYADATKLLNTISNKDEKFYKLAQQQIKIIQEEQSIREQYKKEMRKQLPSKIKNPQPPPQKRFIGNINKETELEELKKIQQIEQTKKEEAKIEHYKRKEAKKIKKNEKKKEKKKKNKEKKPVNKKPMGDESQENNSLTATTPITTPQLHNVNDIISGLINASPVQQQPSPQTPTRKTTKNKIEEALDKRYEEFFATSSHIPFETKMFIEFCTNHKNGCKMRMYGGKVLNQIIGLREDNDADIVTGKQSNVIKKILPEFVKQNLDVIKGAEITGQDNDAYSILHVKLTNTQKKVIEIDISCNNTNLDDLKKWATTKDFRCNTILAQKKGNKFIMEDPTNEGINDIKKGIIEEMGLMSKDPTILLRATKLIAKGFKMSEKTQQTFDQCLDKLGSNSSYTIRPQYLYKTLTNYCKRFNQIKFITILHNIKLLTALFPTSRKNSNERTQNVINRLRAIFSKGSKTKQQTTEPIIKQTIQPPLQLKQAPDFVNELYLALIIDEINCYTNKNLDNNFKEQVENVIKKYNLLYNHLEKYCKNYWGVGVIDLIHRGVNSIIITPQQLTTPDPLTLANIDNNEFPTLAAAIKPSPKPNAKQGSIEYGKLSDGLKRRTIVKNPEDNINNYQKESSREQPLHGTSFFKKEKIIINSSKEHLPPNSHKTPQNPNKNTNHSNNLT